MHPHSALYHFSFPGPPPKGTSEQLQQESSHTTPGGTCPLLCHPPLSLLSQPSLAFHCHQDSYRVLLQNILKHRLVFFHHQAGFLLDLTWSCGETFPNPNVTIKKTRQSSNMHCFNHGPTGLKNCTKCQERPLRKRGSSKEHYKDTQEEV